MMINLLYKPDSFKMTNWEEGNHFEGDIILDDDNSQSAATSVTDRRWPNARIPYVFSARFSIGLL